MQSNGDSPRPLLIATLLLFGGTVLSPFIALDDATHIWQNPYVMSLTPDHLWHFWRTPYYGLYIPAAYDVWEGLAALTQALGLTNDFTVIAAPLFHLTNAALQLVNVYLVWLLFAEIFRRLNGPAVVRRSALIATIPFALHPLQVETVAWASGLKDLLAAGSMVAALVFGLAALPAAGVPGKLKRPDNDRPLPGFFRRLPRVRFLLLSALALVSKPIAVILPLAFLLLAWAVARPDLRRAFRLALPVLGLGAWVALITKGAQPDNSLEFQVAESTKALLALGSLGFYAAKLVAPWPLAPDYGLPPAVFMSHPLQPLFIGLGLSLLGGLALAVKNQWPIPQIALGWFTLGLLPVLGLVHFEFQNVSTVADRYFYLFPALGSGLLLTEVVGRIPNERVRWTFPLALGTAWLILSAIQVNYWRSNDTLFLHTVAVNPKSYLALNNLGLQELRRQNFAEAEALFRQSLDVKPDYLAALANLGVAYFQRGDYTDVITHYRAALAKRPEAGAGSDATYAEIHFTLGAALVNMQQFEQGLVHLRRATVINPDHFRAHFHLGRVLAAFGDKKGARDEFLRALSLRPNDPSVKAELNKL